MSSIKEVSKEEIIEVVKVLVRGYKYDTILHSLKRCPLCALYRNSVLASNCGRCLNKVFVKSTYDYDLDQKPCVKRGEEYSKLNYRYDHNNKYLSMFWQEVGDLITESSENDVINLTTGFRLEVLTIAEKYR